MSSSCVEEIELKCGLKLKNRFVKVCLEYLNMMANTIVSLLSKNHSVDWEGVHQQLV